MRIVVKYEDLLEFVEEIFQKIGFNKYDAKLITKTLVNADLRGVESHGVMRVPTYVQRIQNGDVEVNSNKVVIKESKSTQLIDANNGMGQVVSYHAMEKAMSIARGNGVGAVGVRRSNHFGTAGFYSMMAAKSDMIGISFSNTVPIMPPYNGTEVVIGNNPISIAVPAKSYKPIVLDMALSASAFGKIMMAAREGRSIPEGWALDAKGHMTTDPEKALEARMLLPIGGPKGFGLAVVLDAIAGILTGSTFSVFRDENKTMQCGHFFVALNIESFIPVDVFKDNVDKLIYQIKHVKPVSEENLPMYPGEPEHICEEKRRAEGIPLVEKVFMDLNSVASMLGIKELYRKI